MRSHALVRLRPGIGAALLAFAAGCTEPNHAAVAPAPEPALVARLVVSDTAGADSATVAFELRGVAVSTVGSFTARVAFDSTGLRYVRDVEASDAGDRSVNAQPGLVRVARIASGGFAPGPLYAARFVVVRQGALASLRITVEEIHARTGSDLRSTLVQGAP